MSDRIVRTLTLAVLIAIMVGFAGWFVDILLRASPIPDPAAVSAYVSGRTPAERDLADIKVILRRIEAKVDGRAADGDG